MNIHIIYIYTHTYLHTYIHTQKKTLSITNLQRQPHDTVSSHKTRLRTDRQHLQDEVDWAAGRPESRWRPRLISGEKPPIVNPEVESVEESPFESVLTTHEFAFYEKYMTSFPGGAYSLNQDPSVKPMRTHGKAWVRRWNYSKFLSTLFIIHIIVFMVKSGIILTFKYFGQLTWRLDECLICFKLSPSRTWWRWYRPWTWLCHLSTVDGWLWGRLFACKGSRPMWSILTTGPHHRLQWGTGWRSKVVNVRPGQAGVLHATKQATLCMWLSAALPFSLHSHRSSLMRTCWKFRNSSVNERWFLQSSVSRFQRKPGSRSLSGWQITLIWWITRLSTARWYDDMCKNPAFSIWTRINSSKSKHWFYNHMIFVYLLAHFVLHRQQHVNMWHINIIHENW